MGNVDEKKCFLNIPSATLNISRKLKFSKLGFVFGIRS